MIDFFRKITGNDPFPWQSRLYESFLAGDVPDALDIPTGLGKTASVLLYLLAKAEKAPLPTRLVYIVDRRTIVDQTAGAILDWCERIAKIPFLAAKFDDLAAFPSAAPVRVGILRGGMADDGEWRVDPARPTVVVGTVDMIGSRILFSGYGDGLSRRPMHAGLLGCDATVILDEAHLSPAMVALLTAARDLHHRRGERLFRMMSMSATGNRPGIPCRLDEKDGADTVVRKRLHAVKSLHLCEAKNGADRVARMVELALGFSEGSIAVFTRTVADARKIAPKLVKALGKGGEDRVSILTGTLRGWERANLVNTTLWRRFFPERQRSTGQPAVFLVMTSAGEVGLDLDADHGVMDLNTLDSVFQRVGRINRIGASESEVHLVYTLAESKNPFENEENMSRGGAKYWVRLASACFQTLEVLRELPDLSPATLATLDQEIFERTCVPRAEPVPLHATMVEALAVTTAVLPLPPISLFLRGVTDAPEEPDTYLVWRQEVPQLVHAGSEGAADALTLYRPIPAEIARVPTREARDIVNEAVKRNAELSLPVIIRNRRGEVSVHSFEPDQPIPDLSFATVFLPYPAGGLEPTGLPDPGSEMTVPDVADTEERIRYVISGGPDRELPRWVASGVELKIPLHDLEDESAKPEWLVFAVRKPDPAIQDADSDLTRIGFQSQTLNEHGNRVCDAARRIVAALSLAPEEAHAIETAGKWHDQGKGRRVWQRAAGVSGMPPMAEFRGGRFQAGILGGFRHEFASLVDADAAISADEKGRDLVLHLIASHHGRGRPGFPHPRQWDPETPDSINRSMALEVAGRFGSLQAKYGPWKLAWFEALLKAADAYVSSGRDLAEG